jgi:hypothetical protein
MRKLIALGLLLSCGVAQSAAVSGQGTWETTLQARDVDADGVVDAYYDTLLDITWLADANYVQTSGYDADGKMTWDTAQTWIGTLNTASFLGVNDWRLPAVTDTGPTGCDFAYSGTDCGWNADTSTGEMASLFYDTLGNLALYDTSGGFPQSGYGLTNSGPFSNIQSYYYWADTESASDPSEAWYFHLNFGSQNDSNKDLNRNAWAVRSGDISVVPIPAAIWLFASGLGFLGWFKRQSISSHSH